VVAKNTKKMGITIHNGKQNHRCKECGRQFVIDYEFKEIKEFEKELINKAKKLSGKTLKALCKS
jgi:hypothetical protein